MKKILFSLVLLAASTLLFGQEQHTMIFRNHQEYIKYQLDHPDQIPLRLYDNTKAFAGFSQKLDSVIGSDDFDRTRWKNEYIYEAIADENGETHYSEQQRTEIAFVWESQSWQPSVKTEFAIEDMDSKTLMYRWNGEDWDCYSRITYHYEDLNGETLLVNVLSENYADSAWVGNTQSTYEYDADNHLTLLVNSNMDEEGWYENSKRTYEYDENGNLFRRVYYTKRMDNWRENTLDSLTYDDDHHCTSMSTWTKGGFGPGANQWRFSQRYEFAYLDGQLESETLYAMNWWGTTVNMNNKTSYQFDDNGNLLLKTASIYNGEDWIVRDTYTNSVDMTTETSSILGLAPVWQSTVSKGMGYVLDSNVPLFNKWCSCNIISMNLDTQFDLYYSGFAAVDENHSTDLAAYSSTGRLIVENAMPANITVYDLLGRVVVSKPNVTRAEFNLKQGLYFVSDGRNVVKAIVR